jgi:hypothetical protein
VLSRFTLSIARGSNENASAGWQLSSAIPHADGGLSARYSKEQYQQFLAFSAL